MQVTVEDLGNCKKKLLIEVPAQEVTEELDKRAREWKDSAEVSGFRRGHVPEKLFEKRFGKKLRDALKEDLSAKAVGKALEEHKLEPLGKLEFPGLDKVELERGNPLKFEVQMVAKPQVKVEDYVGVKVRAEEIALTDEEVDSAVERLRRKDARPEPVKDRLSAKEDILLVDVEVKAERQVLYSSKDAYLGAGSEGLFGVKVEGLSGKLAGRDRGETIEVEFDLPESCALEYGKELVGKRAVCALKITDILTLSNQQPDDGWARTQGFETLAALREEARKQIAARKEAARDRYVEQKVLDSLVERCGFEVPAEMMEARAQSLALSRHHKLLEAGVEPGKIDADMEAYRSFSRQEIERNFRESVILEKVAELENIFVTEDKLERVVAELSYRRRVEFAQLWRRMDEEGLLDRLRGDMREARTKEFLRKKAQVELVPPGTLSDALARAQRREEGGAGDGCAKTAEPSGVEGGQRE